jgi:uncharacterized protein YbjT (DUF2867 family)
MIPPPASGRLPRLLLVGGGGGLVGRSALPELRGRFAVRSLHRHPSPREAPDVEWLPADVATYADWDRALEGVDVVVNLAWYRWASERVFRRLSEGLARLLDAAERRKLGRFVHVSVPPAPARLETSLPYLTYKRAFDRRLTASGLSFRIVRPSLLFGPNDKLLTVMLRLIDRYPFFPMFGDGQYRVSPLAASDLGRILAREAASTTSGTLDVGGPVVYRYRELTDLMFRAVGKRPRYWRMTPAHGHRLTALLRAFGSTLLYPYEVEWLTSDLLGLPPIPPLDGEWRRVEPFLSEEVDRRRAARRPGLPPPI